MASSFPSQIPVIVNLLSQLKPASVLDVGKGFGKYGFLLHEYWGIDSAIRPDPHRRLIEQSRVAVDAVESNLNYLWPHIDHFYRDVFKGRIEVLYKTLPSYDLILMIDVIEHLSKSDGLGVVKHFLAAGSQFVIATPRDFFQQELFESPDEHHVSHWTPRDLRGLGYLDYQNVDAGTVYLLTLKPMDLRGFGRGGTKRLRRIARSILNEV